MYNLLLKELKLGVNPFFYLMPFITGALMLIPAWLYFVVILYFCALTIPNMFAGYKSQNDLLFSSMMPVTKKDIVKARVAVIVILELMHIIAAAIYGLLSTHLYPDLIYFFYGPSIGFWGLSFVMLGVFNILFISMYYKTAYKYGAATAAGIVGAVIFAGGAEWLGVSNSVIFNLFKGSGTSNYEIHLTILIIGMIIFTILTYIAYKIAIVRFKKVEL